MNILSSEISPEVAHQFVQLIKQARHIWISTHLNPDGDALGSALALSLLLDQMEISHEVLCHNVSPNNLRFLPNIKKIQLKPTTEADLAIVVDLSSLDRLGSIKSYISQTDQLILVDHHIPNEKPGNLRIIDSSSPATALILSRLFEQIKIKISPQMATCLLTGIVTDTGCFRFPSTTVESLTTAGKLMEYGGDLALINSEIYFKKPQVCINILMKALNKMRIDCDSRLVWSTLSLEDIQEAQALEEHTEGIVNELLTIDTVQIAVMLRESQKGSVQVSLRSRNQYNVAQIANLFNGGGHRNAAGCTFRCSLEEAEKQLITALKTCLGS